MTLNGKYEALQKILRELGQVVVAYSGGVDSTFLLQAAVDTLGTDNVLACTGLGPAEPGQQAERAADMARSLGVELVNVETGEMEDPDFTANNPDRCYHCKSGLCHRLLDVAQQHGFEHVVFGVNHDDLGDYRPGNRAVATFGIRSPLAEAGLTKDDIRELSRAAGLPTADQPASPCLASRIPYGLTITEERLKQIDQAEAFLRSLGFVELRVRHHDTIARLEVRPADIARLTAEPVRSQVVQKLKALGFRFVTVDLQGFRSGSLNEVLSPEQKKAGLRGLERLTE
jgi:uncharacterized protein